MRQINHGLLVLFCLTSLVVATESKKKEQGIHVECHGQLRHGIVAIGGETTGTTISFNRLTWELKLPDDATRSFASEHHKQPVTAVGTLRRVDGTQVPVRWILEVDRLAVPDSKSHKAAAIATVIGKLRHDEAGTGDSAKLIIEADGITWPLDFDHDKKLADKAKALVGKVATIKGEVLRATGTESPRRMQLRVNQLGPSDLAVPD